MELIYTDKGRNDKGVLRNFNIDFDTTNTKDFVITVGSDNHVIAGGAWWYIEGTEYGGIVDEISSDTRNSEIQYYGRNYRGFLSSKIIEPPSGQAYRVVSGTLQRITSDLLSLCRLSGLFVAGDVVTSVEKFKFERYVNLYEGLCDLAQSVGMVIDIRHSPDGKIHISYKEPEDYSDKKEYNKNSLIFKITKNYSKVNHLICLGKGEGKDRLVTHLYTDAKGKITATQNLFGLKEVVSVYDSSAEDEKSLIKDGKKRLKELNKPATFEVSAREMEYCVGDIVSGYDDVTGWRMRAEISNAIVKISDDVVDIEYVVSEDAKISTTTKPQPQPKQVVQRASQDWMGCVKVGNTLILYPDGTVDYEFPAELQNKAELLARLIE